MEKTKEYGARIYHVLPTGFTPPLMVYALKRISSDFVIQLDSEEEISDPLLYELKNLVKYDAYAVKRIEKPSNSYSWQVRIFKKSRAICKGYTHEMVHVESKLVKLNGKDFFISQWSDSMNPNKIKRYLALDVLMRPLSYDFILSKIQRKEGWRETTFSDAPISNFFLGLYKLLFYYNSVVFNSKSKELKSHLKYLNLHLNTYKYISSDFLYKLGKIRKEIEVNGGPIKYLCLDDIGYVDSLSNNEAFGYDGISIFMYLVNFRFENRKCAPNINYEDLQRNSLYRLLIEAIQRSLGILFDNNYQY
jgi:hypothetical protein